MLENSFQAIRLVYLLVLGYCFLSVHQCTAVQQKLLLVSFDGFRHDYLELALKHGVNISGFQRIWKSGVRVERVINEFITRTGPNHFSLVTGQHEESHGLVDNTFYDPTLKETFTLSNEAQSYESKWFDVGSEPIWVTNQRNNHKSAVSFWPGAHAKIKGQAPSYVFKSYNKDIPLSERIDKIISWLKEDEVTIGLLYYHEPDAVGHQSGPESRELLFTIGKLNTDIEYLLTLIEKSPTLKESLNIILTSDHGMHKVSTRNVIVLESMINSTMYNSPGPDHRIVWSLWPKPGFTAMDLYEKLKDKHDNLNVYLKNDVPRRLFYSKNDRIGPVLIFTNPGWMIVRSTQSIKTMAVLGDHGYDPVNREMSPFFLATGPSFKQEGMGKTLKSIKLIDIYPLMCHILNLDTVGHHNGSLSGVIHLLREEKKWFFNPLDTFTGIDVSMDFELVNCSYIESTPQLYKSAVTFNFKCDYLRSLFFYQNVGVIFIIGTLLAVTMTISVCLSGHIQQSYQPNIYLLQRRSRNTTNTNTNSNITTKIINPAYKSNINNSKFQLPPNFLTRKQLFSNSSDTKHLLRSSSNQNNNNNNNGNDDDDDDDDDDDNDKYGGSHNNNIYSSNKFSHNYIDDQTFINLLREPRSHYP